MIFYYFHANHHLNQRPTEGVFLYFLSPYRFGLYRFLCQATTPNRLDGIRFGVVHLQTKITVLYVKRATHCILAQPYYHQIIKSKCVSV